MHDKKKIRTDGKKIGLFIICNQIFFQVGTIVMLLVLVNIFANLNVSKEISDTSMFLASDMMQLIAGTMFIILFLRNRNYLSDIPKNKIKLLDFIKAFLVILGANMIVSMVEFIVQRLFGIHLADIGVSMLITSGNMWIMLFLIAIFPAIIEEFLYRGIIYRIMREHGIYYAMVGSSLIFGLIHMNFVQTPFAFVLGIVNCYLYEKTGKLRYSMIAHFLNNSLIIIMGVLPISSFVSNGIQVILGLVYVIVIFILCVKYKDECKKLFEKIKMEKEKIYYFLTSISMIILVIIYLIVAVLMVKL